MSKHNLPFSFRTLVLINLGMLLLIIFFGLHFKSFSFCNNVAWIDGQDGIRFGHYGIAYSQTAFPTVESGSGSKDLSLELAVRPDDSRDDRFKILLSIHAGDDREQLLIGQWRSSLIVMNGDDYDGSKRTPKIGVNNVLPPQINTLIQITSGADGTHVYIDGRLRQSNGRLILRVPNDTADAVLVLGNSPYGRHSWTGDIFGLAIYEDSLNPGDAASHFDHWSRQQVFSFPRNVDPKLLYSFGDQSGLIAVDQGREDHHLIIPSRMKILKKEILVAPWNEDRYDSQLFQDMAINLVGFILPGFFFCALMINIGGFYEKNGLVVTFCACFLVSLTIELVQAWIPSRSSQSLDLIFNTLGGCIGAVLYRTYHRAVCRMNAGDGFSINL